MFDVGFEYHTNTEPIWPFYSLFVVETEEEAQLVANHLTPANMLWRPAWRALT